MESIGALILIVGFIAVGILFVYHLIGMAQLKLEMSQARARLSTKRRIELDSLDIAKLLTQGDADGSDRLNVEFEMYRFFKILKGSMNPYVEWAASIVQLAISDVSSATVSAEEIIVDGDELRRIAAVVNQFQGSSIWESLPLRLALSGLVSNWQTAILNHDGPGLFEAVSKICWLAVLRSDPASVDWVARDQQIDREVTIELLRECRAALGRGDGVGAFIAMRPWTQKNRIRASVPSDLIVPILHMVRRVAIVADPAGQHPYTRTQLHECFEWVSDLLDQLIIAIDESDYPKIVELLMRDQVSVHNWFILGPGNPARVVEGEFIFTAKGTGIE